MNMLNIKYMCDDIAAWEDVKTYEREWWSDLINMDETEDKHK